MTEVISIRFKSGGKDYFFDPDGNKVKIGDKVIVAKYSGTEVKIDDNEYTILRQSDILAVVE